MLIYVDPITKLMKLMSAKDIILVRLVLLSMKFHTIITLQWIMLNPIIGSIYHYTID